MRTTDHACTSPGPVRIHSFEPLHGLLERKAVETPDALAFRFLVDGDASEETVTCGGLAARARGLARTLLDHGAAGKPVLLIRPPGIGFIEGLFACWLAGAIAVPAYPPRGTRHRQRMMAILKDCGARLALAAPDQQDISGVTIPHHDDTPDFSTSNFGNTGSPDGICLLQYTSGSTADPKGVMISHRNLRSHFNSIGYAEELGLNSSVSWLPPYHDMGLVLKILHSFEAGMPLTFFSPEHFIQRPARWLRAISRYRAELSGAPNFAYEACVRSVRDEDIRGIDLSCWKAAVCGAERIRADTLERFAERFAPYGFRAESFILGYGLAEATLTVTSSPLGRKPEITESHRKGRPVSCGVPVRGVELRIVNPSTGEECAERETGEIRIKGPCVAAGYWRNQAATRETFGDESDRELRSGDLGYLEDGHLHVCGRIKDLIILDGVNHAAEDIEAELLAAIPEITTAAAFAMEHDNTESLVIAAETSGGSHAATAALVRRVLADRIGISAQRVVLTRKGLLPRTTSGKIRRMACRQALEEETLRILHDDHARQFVKGAGEDMLGMILEAVKRITGRQSVERDDDVIGLGMGSLDATRLVAEMRAHTGIDIPLADVFSVESFSQLAARWSASSIKSGAGLEIIPGSGSDGRTLSHAQERMWFLHQFDPLSAAYHVFGTIELLGGVSESAMRDAFRRVISSHDILMSRHGEEKGRPKVWIDRETIAELAVVHAADEEALHSTLRSFAKMPFDLAGAPPIRAMLVRCDAQRHVLAVCAHHIVADGWSLRLLANDLAEHFSNSDGAESGRRISYQDFGAAHRKWVDGGAVDAQVEYWKQRLEGHSGVMNLPADFPRPPHPTADGALVIRNIPQDLADRITALAGERRATPFMVHLAALCLLLHQHGAGHDMVVAIPVANRNHAAAANLIGTLVNTLPFRMTVDGGEAFTTLLERVRAASFGMQENQDAPFERIIDEVRPERASGHTPLAQVMFDHQEIPIPEKWADGIECRYFQAHRGAAQFDLSLLLTVFNDHQQLAFEYRTELFLERTITAMLDRYLVILENLCSTPYAPVRSILRLADRDGEWLAMVSDGPARPDFLKRTTLSLFQSTARVHGSRVAVTAGNQCVTYQELECASDRIADNLRGRGILPGDRVAVLMERNTLLPAVLLAIWKAGAAYVPLDQSNPPERLRLILDSTPHVITSTALLHHLPAGVFPMRVEDLLNDGCSAGNPPLVSPGDNAYVIHTSGSTGVPKGVVVSHQALANFLLSMAETPGFTSADRLLAITTISFDISTLELFLPLITGGSLEIITVDEASDGHALLERIRTGAVTVMQATPATWRLLLEAGWKGAPYLKILCGGEALDPQIARQLVRMGSQLWNLYGPTETTVWSTAWRVPKSPDRIRIGTPIANTGVHIVSPDGDILPPGVAGNLWISGTGLAECYWGRPDLTAERFATLTRPDGRKIRAYHTGDIARWHDDGTLECLGRSDDQVKIRGFRVELGEIESALASHPQVAQARAGIRGGVLVAWITLGGTGVEIPSIRNHLMELLPLHMLPADIVTIASFPLNSSGKVDMNQLPAPVRQAPEAHELTATERGLADIWRDLLERDAIHPDDNWFHIGGHSLLALRMFARIHETFGCRMPLSSILDHPTPRSLAARIDHTIPDR